MQQPVKLYDLVMAFSNALDQVHPALTGHHLRVGFLLDRLAERLGLSDSERHNLFWAGVMHDVGVVPLKISAADLIFERERFLHPKAGWLFLKECPTLETAAELVRHHHTYWEKARDREAVVRAGCLINIVDRADVLLRGDAPREECARRAAARLRQRRRGVFAPRHLEALLDVLHDGESLAALDGIHGRLPGDLRERYGRQTLRIEEIIRFSTLFGHVIDSCSPFTATHSTGVAYVARALGHSAGLGENDRDTLFVAGMLHDIGKLGIPAALLEKPGPLTETEFPRVKKHADLSRRWLDAVPGFQEVSLWGSCHHERLDGTGYPLGLKADELPIPARIMSIADVFTALTEDRPYRKGMILNEALRVVEGMAARRHLDGDLVRVMRSRAEEINEIRIRAQNEARRKFQALHEACAAPDADQAD